MLQKCIKILKLIFNALFGVCVGYGYARLILESIYKPIISPYFAAVIFLWFLASAFYIYFCLVTSLHELKKGRKLLEDANICLMNARRLSATAEAAYKDSHSLENNTSGETSRA